MAGPLGALVWAGGKWVLKAVAGGAIYDFVDDPIKDWLTENPGADQPRPPSVYADGNIWRLQADGNYEREDGPQRI